ncbi:GNAT family acetyltransferase [Herminiimonas sp. KBW02]|uniref:TolC family protein n=1 Tax=Herminiimonas sp. KBW02 TaxID=2153363 RepID=UPI000F592CBC|nr:TolC family protein [Herminiimonas sp. KBW02]RQO34015.1 GNAT family acetyltransferase [Herminiimonas sp. KBW02]
MCIRNFLIRHFGVWALIALISPIGYAQSNQVDLKTAIEGAWQRLPQARALEAKRDEASAGQEASRSWIAGSPSIGLMQRSDRWHEQTGVRESEVSMAAPIWLPEQRAVRQTLADSSANALEGQIADSRLTVAGEVRELLWSVASARQALEEAKGHQRYLEALAKDVGKRVKAGDLARTDELLAQQEALAAEGRVVAFFNREQAELARFKNLTGLLDIPSLVVERTPASVPELHPRMQAARTSLERAQAAMKVVSTVRSDPPTVGLLMRHDQGRAMQESSRTIGIALQIPIGTRSRNRPLETAAITELETATAEVARTESVLGSDIALARQQLQASEQSLTAAIRRNELAKEHTRHIEKAFRLGERSLFELLRSRTSLHEAEMAERQQHVVVGLSHARLNQALGIIP